jgi:hypothetical protein
MSHRPQLERVLRFVAAPLERSISVAELARAAHLQRAFHAEVGALIARLFTWRGLELAALRLVYETTRVLRAMQRAGHRVMPGCAARRAPPGEVYAARLRLAFRQARATPVRRIRRKSPTGVPVPALTVKAMAAWWVGLAQAPEPL